MIDDQAQAKALMRKMEAQFQLPIPVRATEEFVRLIKSHGLKLERHQALSIKGLFYAGDEGGITCDVTPPETDAAIVCSLTHVEIEPDHPLAEEIRAYQQARKKELARKGCVPSSVLIPNEALEARKRRRRRWQ
jgi:hypothetical protein